MLLIAGLNLLGRFELSMQDRLNKNLGLVDPNIFVFGIDEDTLIEFGPFQFWPRSRIAEAISILNSVPDEKPAVIAVDILFSGSGGDEESDAALVRAAQEGGNVVYGAMASYDRRGEVRTFEKPFGALERVSKYGAMNTIIDDDGVVRRTAAFIDTADGREPTFAAAIYEMYTGSQLTIPQGFGNRLYLTMTGAVGDYYGAEGLGTGFPIFSAMISTSAFTLMPSL